MIDTVNETAIELGLDIENFPGKWKQAKKLAIYMAKRDYPEENAFQLACRLYIELGGERRKPRIHKINQFKITEHDDGSGISVSCDRIGSHIQICPASLCSVVITTDD